tara:strand:- start:183 stop:998 length:816 start_codon:yes stop_codon:yes gene_type:complete
MSDHGFKRNLSEKFYTKSEVAKICISYFIQTIMPKVNSYIIEPSAGSGSFSNPLKKSFKNVVAIDIDKELEYTVHKDYLTYEPNTSNKIHVIGNPPFGRQLSLARKFIQHSAKFAESISFILPKSFKKESVQKIFPLEFHLLYEWELPKNSFYIAKTGKRHDVPTVFQIWRRSDTLRTVREKPLPRYFSFLKYGDDTIDFAIRRVGGTAGKIVKEWKGCSIQSHYFIRLDSVNTDDFMKLYDSSVFPSNNTVGPRSISKTELIDVMNSLKI